MRGSLSRVAALTLALLSASVALRSSPAGQTPAGAPSTTAILGVVRDERGRPVPDVGVTAVLASAAPRAAAEQYDLVGRQTRTDSQGTFRFGGLSPGEYVVMVAAHYSTYTLDATPSTHCVYQVPELRWPPNDFSFQAPVQIEPARGARDETGWFFRTIEPGLTPAVRAAGEAVIYVTTYAPSAVSLDRATKLPVVRGRAELRADVTLQLRPSVRVTGRVISDRRPTTGWRLELTGSFGTAHGKANPDGLFGFMDVPAGTHDLVVMEDPYCGDTRVANPLRWRVAQPWRLGPGDVHGVRIHLLPWEPTVGTAVLRQVADSAAESARRTSGDGMITGHVTSAAGLPLDRAIVGLARVPGEPERTTVSDDHGVFVFSGLPAGSFRLTASRHGFLPVIYGQKQRHDQGTAIRLAAGGRFDASMILVGHGSISGTVFNERGEPLARADVWGGGEFSTTDQTGGYRLVGVPPGEHRVFARSSAFDKRYFPGVADETLALTVPVYSGQDTPGIDIRLESDVADRKLPSAPADHQLPSRPANRQLPIHIIPTRVVFDVTGTARPSLVTVDALEVAGEQPFRVIGFSPNSSMYFADNNWRSDLEASPSPHILTVDVTGWHARSAMVDGRDVLDVPFVPSAKHEIILTLTDRFTRVTGIVRDGLGRPTADATVVVFSADRQFWTARSRRIRVVRPSSDGTYEVIGLPAGQYAVAALEDLPVKQPLDPEFVERVSVTPVRARLVEEQTVERDVAVLRLPAR